MPLTTVPSRPVVAAKIPDHTYDAGSNRLDDFRASGSPPTRADADAAIITATSIIRGRVGRIPAGIDETDERWIAVAALLVAITATRAAMELVRNIDQPEYDRLKREFDDLLPDVIAALRAAINGEDPSPTGTYAGARWSFPQPMSSLDEAF